VFATWKGSEQEIDTAAMARDGWTHLTRQVWPSKRRHLKWPPIEPVTDETFTTFEAMLKPPTVAVSDAD